MHPKDADGMANSVDPDQTASSEAVWSWSALFAETYLSQYIEFVQYYTYVIIMMSYWCLSDNTENILPRYYRKNSKYWDTQTRYRSCP